LRLKPAQNGYFLPKLIFFQKSSAWVKQKNFQDFEIGFLFPPVVHRRKSALRQNEKTGE